MSSTIPESFIKPNDFNFHQVVAASSSSEITRCPAKENSIVGCVHNNSINSETAWPVISQVYGLARIVIRPLSMITPARGFLWFPFGRMIGHRLVGEYGRRYRC